MKKRVFTVEFKQEAASLVLDQNYTIEEAAQTIGVSKSAMTRWVRQLREERFGKTPATGKALTPAHQKIKELELKIKRIEMEKEILKKATALLMSENRR